MNKRVYNKTFGKIFRTLGFLLILVSSIYFGARLVLEYNTLPLMNFLSPFADFIDSIIGIDFIQKYAFLMLLVGLTFVVWAIRRGIIFRVLLTFLLLVMSVYAMVADIVYMTWLPISVPIWWASILDFATPLIDQLFALHGAVEPAIVLLVPILLWIIFRNKKPGRLSIFMMRMGSVAMALAIIMVVVATDFFTDLQGLDIYVTIYLMAYIFTYLFYIVGSVFGIIGMTKP